MKEHLCDIEIIHNLEIPMRDGVILRANWYRPKGEGTYPAVLMRMPYLKDTFERRWGPLSPLRIAQHGYHVIIQDIRGCGESEGEADLTIHQGPDGYDTVEWIAAQDWCDGKVGMYGLSFYGYTQLACAETLPPHLVTICPFQQASTSKYGGGFTPNVLHMEWLLKQGQNYLLRTKTMDEEKKKEIQAKLQDAIENLPKYQSFVPEIENPLMQIPEIPFLRDYLDKIEHYDDEFFPRSQDGRPLKMDQITTPCLLYAGWCDTSSKNGPIENYQILREKGATQTVREGTRLVIGPWPHGTTFATQMGERSFPGADGDQVDVQGDIIRWFDYWLKGEDNGFTSLPRVRLYVMGENRWRDEEDWPIARTVYKDFYLGSGGDARTYHGNGTLSSEKTEGRDTFLYDPANPVPSRVPGVAPMAICDRRPLEERSDVLVYSTEPLTEDVEVTGEIKAMLQVSTSGRDTDFMCTLIDVTPEGKALNVTDGAVRLRYNNGYTAREILPGEKYEVEVRLGNTSNLFKKGHQIRLEVTSSNFPMYDRNHNTGKRIGTDAELLVVENSVFHDSRLVLPVIPR